MHFTFLVLLFILGLTGNAVEARLLKDQAEMVAFVKEVKQGHYQKIGSVLGEIYVDYMSKDEATVSDVLDSLGLANATQTMEDDKILVDIVCTTEEPEFLESALESIGFVVLQTTKHICSGYMPVDTLLEVNDMDAINFVLPSLAEVEVGSVESEASESMFADVARDRFGVNGTGLTIGVLSNSFDALNDYADDIVSGDLPDDVNVLLDFGPTGFATDEGRAMLQLIHDVAPGASLAFHTAFTGQAGFAQGIRDLANIAHCDVIVDDVRLFVEPMFQDGIIAQAVDDVVAQGVAYFASGGNYRRNSWEGGAFVDSGLTDPLFGNPIHDFGGGVTRQTIQTGGVFIFNWDEPYASASAYGPGSSSDIDILFYEPGAEFPKFYLGAINVGRDPIELLNLPSGTFEMEIVLWSGPAPNFMKWVIRSGQDLANDFETNSGTGYGHSNAALAAGVGAAQFGQTPGFGTSPANQRSFSSAGGVPILFDRDGNRLRSPEIRMQPRFVGPDGVSTSMQFPFSSFPGTSAAAPNVAAVALLMLEASGYSYTPQQIYSILEQTAEDMDDAFVDGPDFGFDFGTGYGFVNALSAVAGEQSECLTTVLWDADNDVPADGITSDKKDVFCKQDWEFNVEAKVDCRAIDNIDTISFELTGPNNLRTSQTERVDPWFAFGDDTNGQVFGRDMDIGTYSVEITINYENKRIRPYSESIHFEIVDCRCDVPLRPEIH